MILFMPVFIAPPRYAWHVRLLKIALLLLWAVVSFGTLFFARDLQVSLSGWPLHYWIGAQGGVLVFVGIVVVYAWAMNRWEQRSSSANQQPGAKD
jgi:putative solute:sodium symporter small subunit